MLISDLLTLHTEIETKFLGGENEYGVVVDWLTIKGGFSIDSRDQTHRLHIYFDADNVLHRARCSLRCVIAAGEWCRYDFKESNQTNQSETLEMSTMRASPISITAVMDQMLDKLADGEAQKALSEVRNSARVALIMLGRHQKTMARRGALELEVSWDVLVSMDFGVPLSEIEVELRAGDRPDFDHVIGALTTELDLTRSDQSKYQKMLELGAHPGRVGQ